MKISSTVFEILRKTLWVGAILTFTSILCCRSCVSSESTYLNADEYLHCTLISVVALTVTPPVVAKQTYEPSSLREIEGMR